MKRSLSGIAARGLTVIVLGGTAAFALTGPATAAEATGAAAIQRGPAAAVQSGPNLAVRAFGDLSLKNAQTGKCLTIAGGRRTDSSWPALQFDCDNDASRRWSFFGPGAGYEEKPIKRIGRAVAPEEAELLRLINDARAHPANYPPHGNTQGAHMNTCANPAPNSSGLRQTAGDHNAYLASQPINWVNTFPNMHKDPNGHLVWDSGEPMDKAGYHSYRAENVATGFPTPADVMRFWMQDDEPSAWGHRNLILNCAVQEAGTGHLQGGPGNHYWTLDMGTR